MIEGGDHGLLVDLYELTMLDVYLRSGMAQRPSTFSLFVRHLPDDRGVLVAAGLDDCLSWLEGLRFDPDAIAQLQSLGVFEADFLEWLGGLRFTGQVRAVAEGTPVFAGEPILEVDAPLGQAQLAETYLLNQVTLQTNLATSAARFVHAAGGRDVVDFGLRRAPGIDAGMKLVRAGRIAGIAATSNVAGALRYGMPTSGTMAHSLVQAHVDEADAFRDFARADRERTILLVDTYDTATGIERAIEVATECRADGYELAGIRIDSGDLVELSRLARQRLDASGFSGMKIVVSGGLDEHDLAALVASGAPVDAFGVGSALAASPEAPVIDTVYKLAAFDGRPVRKTSPGKTTWPCPKQVWRDHTSERDVLALRDESAPAKGMWPLLEPVMVDGRRTEAGTRSLDEAHQHFSAQWAALPERCTRLVGPEPIVVEPSAGLMRSVAQLDGQRVREEVPPARPAS